MRKRLSIILLITVIIFITWIDTGNSSNSCESCCIENGKINTDIEKYINSKAGGTLIMPFEDINIKGISKDISMNVKRIYNNKNGSKGYFGYGWNSNLELKVYPISSSIYFAIITENGGVKKFTKVHDGLYKSRGTTVIMKRDGGVTIIKKDGVKYNINSKGRLKSYEDRNKNKVEINYNRDKIISMRDSSGRELKFFYKDTLITKIVDNTEREYNYYYDDYHNLIKYKDATGREIRYEYDNQHNLTNIIYPNNEYSRIVYSKGEKQKCYVTEIRSSDNVNKTYQYNYTVRVDGTKGFKKFEEPVEKHPDEVIIKDKRGSQKIIKIKDNGKYIETINALGKKSITKKNKLMYAVEEIDENGHSIKYKRDANGNIIVKKDAVGNIWKYEYNKFNKKSIFVNPDGAKKKYEYDERGNLIKEIDELGNKKEYEYDENGLMKSEKDARGNITEYEYDENGNLLKVIDKNGNEREYVYDKYGRVIKETSSSCCGSFKEYEYDGYGNVIKEKDAQGYEINYKYDIMGNKIEKIDAKENKTKYYYDGSGQIIKRTRYGSEINETYEYDIRGNIIRSIDGNGNVTRFAYDDLERLIRVTNALDYIIETKYDDAGNITNAIDEVGNITKIYYNANNKPIKVIDPLGLIKEVGYDSVGRVSYKIDKNGNRTDFEYDAAGNLKKIIDAYGNVEERTHDQNGNILTVNDRMGKVTEYVYNEMNKVIEIKDPLGNSSYNEYDSLNRLSASIDKNGNRTEYVYNDKSKLTEKINSQGYSHKYSYDANGNLTSQINYNNEEVKYEYDAFDRRIKEIDPLGNENVYVYDDNNNIIIRTDANGNSTRYAYDVLNRIIAITNAEDHTTKFIYDEVGNRTDIINAKDIVRKLYYDANNRLIKIKSPLGKEIIYEYDGVGYKTKRINPDGHVTDYVYNKLNQLTDIKYDTGNNVTFIKDAFGRITEYTSPEETVKMEYDDLGRLVYWNNETLNKEIRYSYDAMWNRTEMIDTEKIKTSYAYDANNNLTEIKLSRTPVALNDDLMMPNSMNSEESTPNSLLQNEVESASIEITEDYILTQDIEFSGDGFIIGADNITIDGNGYTIKGLGGNGITINGKKNITIKNIRIENFRWGMNIKNAENISVENAEIINNTFGIEFTYGGSDFTLENSKIIGSRYGIRTISIDRVSLINNEIRECEELGIKGTYGHGSIYENNVIKNNGRYGIMINLVWDTTIKGNLIENNGSGISFAGGRTIEIYQNTIKNNGNGIYADRINTGDILIIWNNNIYNNGNGMYIRSPNDISKTYLDYDNKGNYWGRPYPGPLFVPGVDCNIVELVDHYPYGYENEWLPPITIMFEYDPIGRVKKQINENGTFSSYNYSGRGDLLSIIHQKENLDVMERFTYTYDQVGNRLSAVSLDGTIDYQYDKTYQLLRADYPDGEYEVFEYDEVGNRKRYNKNGTIVDYNYDIEDRLLQAGNTTYEYDANGNQIKATTGANVEDFEYNEENLLSRYMGNGNDATYAYSPFGQRIRKTVNGNSEYYIYNDEDVILEYDSALNVKASYTFGDFIDDPILQKRNNKEYYYQQDGLGSVTSLVDENAEVKNSYKYYAYGESKSKTETIENRYQYTGREIDNENNSYYYRSRIYNQFAGRFIQKDKELFKDLNPYRYVLNNPVMNIDPFGKWAVESFQLSFSLGKLFSLSISASVNVERTDKICPCKTDRPNETVTDTTLKASANASLGVSASSFECGSIKKGKFKYDCWVGYNVSANLDFSLSGEFKSDLCNGIDMTYNKICGDLTLSGTISMGGMFELKWRFFDISSCLFGSGTISGGGQGCYSPTEGWSFSFTGGYGVKAKICLLGTCFTPIDEWYPFGGEK